MPSKICLFLGYDNDKTKLINFLEKNNIQVKKKLDEELKKKDIVNTDIIISFGYRKIISKKILSQLKRPIINLHMSFLPYNRGSHPNFWSFVENTPKGVSIHEVSNGIDDGDIIFQKKFELDPSLEKFSTFEKTYNYLFIALENLFIENFEKIINHTYTTKKQGKFYTFHFSKELPKNIFNWDTNIQKYLSKQKQI